MEPITLTTEQQDQLLAALAARSGLYSPKFWTRAFTVWGHAMAAMFLTYLALGFIVFLIVGIASLAGK